MIFSLFITFLSFKFYSVSRAWTLASLFIGSLIISRYLFVIYAYIFQRKFVNIYSVLAHLGLGLLIISIALNNDFSSERAMNIKINVKILYCLIASLIRYHSDISDISKYMITRYIWTYG